jgi:hypothetical protein
LRSLCAGALVGEIVIYNLVRQMFNTVTSPGRRIRDIAAGSGSEFDNLNDH